MHVEATCSACGATPKLPIGVVAVFTPTHFEFPCPVCGHLNARSGSTTSLLGMLEAGCRSPELATNSAIWAELEGVE